LLFRLTLVYMALNNNHSKRPCITSKEIFSMFSERHFFWKFVPKHINGSFDGTIFAIILRQLEKWENDKDILPESNGCAIVLKANYFWFQNIIKHLIKSF
jgi:hypothetical protein